MFENLLTYFFLLCIIENENKKAVRADDSVRPLPHRNTREKGATNARNIRRTKQ